MNPFIQQIVNNKVNSLTKSELIQLAQQNKITITDDQANKVITIVKSEKIDVSNKEQVNRMIYRLQTEVDHHVSSVIQQLLQQFSKFF